MEKKFLLFCLIFIFSGCTRDVELENKLKLKSYLLENGYVQDSNDENLYVRGEYTIEEYSDCNTNKIVNKINVEDLTFSYLLYNVNDKVDNYGGEYDGLYSADKIYYNYSYKNDILEGGFINSYCGDSGESYIKKFNYIYNYNSGISECSVGEKIDGYRFWTINQGTKDCSILDVPSFLITGSIVDIKQDFLDLLYDAKVEKDYLKTVK